MPFILPNGATFRIDYFNVVRNNTGVIIEYLHDGKLIATQEMSANTSQEVVTILPGTDNPVSYVAEMKFTVNGQLIHADSFLVRKDSTHVHIDYYYETNFVLEQRMTIGTAQEIAKEISG